MTKLDWDQTGDRFFETGVDRGVFYPLANSGVAWNGLTSVHEAPSGGDTTPYYLDGVKYLNISTPQEYAATIEAYTYPDEFAECDGTVFDDNGLGYGMQVRKPFSLSYRTRIGNDLDGPAYGYKIHLIYNALAAPSDRNYATLGASPEAINFSWTISTTPIRIPGRRATSHLIVDSTKISKYLLTEVENILYGSDLEDPRLPLPDELIDTFGWEMFQIIPDVSYGLAQLSPDGAPDLKSNMDPGLYTTTVGTKLTETAFPGLYNREEI